MMMSMYEKKKHSFHFKKITKENRQSPKRQDRTGQSNQQIQLDKTDSNIFTTKIHNLTLTEPT